MFSDTYNTILNFPSQSTDQDTVLIDALAKENDNITEFTISVWFQMIPNGDVEPTVFSFEGPGNKDVLSLYFKTKTALDIDFPDGR